MIPPVGLVHSVEMIRDGGSLAAVFQGTDGCEYWVCLPVRQHRLPSGEWERTGYKDPAVVDRLAQRQLPISWQQAQVFLSQVRPLLHAERDFRWFQILSEAVQLQGALPAAVTRDFGRSDAQSQDGQT